MKKLTGRLATGIALASALSFGSGCATTRPESVGYTPVSAVENRGVEPGTLRDYWVSTSDQTKETVRYVISPGIASLIRHIWF